MRRCLIFFILLVQKPFIAFPCSHLTAFDDYVNAIYQRQNFTEEEDFESIKEALREAYAAPLDLNKVTEEALAALGILSKNQIKNYFNHLTATGPLYSKYELQAIPGFDLTTITLLLPFVAVAESDHLSSNRLKINESRPSYFLFRYAPSCYATSTKPTLGNLDRCTVQLSFNHNNDMTWGVTARKQAGESFCWDHATYRYGFNLWSIFMMVTNKKFIKRMIIGDYQLGYGQGLLLSAGYIQTGDAIAAVMRSNNVGIRPYKGIRRIGLRGVAITSDIGPIELTGFYANHNLDATLKLNAANQPYANRIDCTGKYDTIHNLAQKGTIHQQVVGCTLRKSYHRNQTEVGVNLLYTHYDIPILEQATAPYFFQSAASLFYRLLWKNWIVFGETGLTWPNAAGKALITGFIISLSRYVDLSVAWYYYGKRFYTPYGNPFKRYTADDANEQGGYLSWQFTPLPSWQIATSGHFFATLSPKPRLAIPSNGYRFTTRSSYIWNRATILVLQHKLHKNPKNKPKDKKGDAAAEVAHAIQNSFKCKLDHKLTHAWWTYLELQYTQYTFLEKTHHGYAWAGGQKWQGDRWQLAGKVIYFQTQSYAARLYFYLPNPLYSGTLFQPYYGQGIAMSWLVCWKPIGSVRIELNYTFIYSDFGKKSSSQTSSTSKGLHSGMIKLLIR